MTSTIPPLTALSRIRQRSADALLGIARLNDPALAQWLSRAMSAAHGVDGWPVLPPPLLEAAHPFMPSSETMESLEHRLLHPDLVAALAGEDDPSRDRYRMGRDLRPYRHQLDAWQILSRPDPRSLVVTSGTGSGKTECFLIPLLNDLARQAAGGRKLEGVQAIALYPLNALIESQRERLSDWCTPFQGRIRFGLYNGDLPEQVRASDLRASLAEVPDRATLRQSPPPILVTNITMLEYMLVRAKDEPLLEKSRGQLRWIILDEAHTHIGSAAAELALLLRRVMQAFAVDPEQVRFVATSATIGSGPSTRAALQKFLADVAGLETARIDVVEGSPAPIDLPPALPNHRVEASQIERLLTQEDSEVSGRLFDLLAPSPAVQRFMADLDASKLAEWDRVELLARELGLDTHHAIEAMARASRGMSERGARTLGPLRIQAFHRSIPGVWSCVNPECSGKPFPEWSFGAVYPSARDCCHHCQSPVVTVAACTECGEPYLLAREAGGSLADVNAPVIDEFSDEPDRSLLAVSAGADEEEATGAATAPERAGMTHAIATRAHPGAHRLDVRIPQGVGDTTVPLRAHRTDCCAQCGAEERIEGSLLRPLRFSSPLLLRNATPILLDTTAPTPPEPDQPRKPSDGRRLLSFSDSRQGTARLAAFLQADSERTFLRSMVYHTVQGKKQEGGAPDLQGQLEFLRTLPETGQILDQIAKLEDKVAKAAPALSFEELVSRVAGHPDLAHWILPVWNRRDQDLFGRPEQLAKFFILREFARRPRSANSAETMGLAAMRFKELCGLRPPSEFTSNGGTAGDWEDYLHIASWAFLRANLILDIDKSLAEWMLPKAGLKRLVHPADRGLAGGEIAFPRARPKGSRGRLAQLLYAGLGLDPNEQNDREVVESILDETRRTLGRVMTTDGTGQRLDIIGKASFVAVEDCFACPETRRILDRTFRGLTPWGSNSIFDRGKKATAIKMPSHPAPFLSADGQDEWLRTAPEINVLRAQGLWTSLHDRLVPNPSFARSAEHSAQQPRRLLKGYETAFARGEINILNCSTTMEMGVDIGAVSTVLLSNVPPSLSSYRQRIGRAGRRGQPMSLSFTICKDRPLDREVFQDPKAFLKRRIAAPSVSLDSRPIVQRHINALALGHYLRSIDANAMSGTVGAFLLPDPQAPGPSWGRRFGQFLRTQEALKQLEKGITQLVRSTCLQAHAPSTLLETAADAIDLIRTEFKQEVEALKSQKTGDRPADRAVDFQIKRLTDEYLLASLSSSGFLPGHGFPTDVVPFLPAKRKPVETAENEDGARPRFAARDAPQRSLDLAIRDYAPGTDIVIDGLIHRSAGVTLNWKRPASEELKEVQSLRWILSCRSCGELVDTVSRPHGRSCPTCGSSDVSWRRWLRPAGFTSDFRTPVHAEIETPAFVPAEPVRVTATGASWMPMAEPDSGRFRSNTEGMVFHENRGTHGHGFAVCLECGRAEAETSNRPEDTKPLAGHYPLRGRGEEGSGLCPSHSRTYSIARHLSFGVSVQTDVVELELPGLRTAAAWALASAFRTATAGMLGVEPSELGIAVTPRTDPMGRQAHAIILWDKATGGAGFATQAPLYLDELLQRSIEILDCNVPGCVTGCANCVLDPDTSNPGHAPDRAAALAFVKTLIERNQALPAALGRQPGAKLVRHLLDDLASVVREGSGYSSVTVFASHLGPAGAVGASGLATILRDLRKTGLSCTVALASGLVDQASSADRLALRDFALEAGVTLVRLASQVVLPGDGAQGHLLAVLHGSRTLSWISEDASGGQLGESFGLPQEHPIVRVTGTPAFKTDTIDLGSLLPPPATHKLIQIKSETDRGQIVQTAHAIAGRIHKEAQSLLPRAADLVRLNYSDRYLRDPVTALLMLQTVAALAKLLGHKPAAEAAAHVLPVQVTTQPLLDPYGRPRSTGVQDWTCDRDREQVMVGIGHQLGLNVTIKVAETIGHARSARLYLSTGVTLDLFLDQGFGAWRGPRLPRGFQIQSATSQIRALLELKGAAALPHGASTHIVIGAAS